MPPPAPSDPQDSSPERMDIDTVDLSDEGEDPLVDEQSEEESDDHEGDYYISRVVIDTIDLTGVDDDE